MAGRTLYRQYNITGHRALSAIRNNGVSAFQGEVHTGSIGLIVGTLESVRIIEVSTFQGCPQGGVPLYVTIRDSKVGSSAYNHIHTYIHTYTQLIYVYSSRHILTVQQRWSLSRSI